MLAAGAGGMSKSISWDHSYAAGLKMRADKAADAARRAAKQGSRVEAAAKAAKAKAAAARAGGGGGEAVHIPRSVSCSSLAEKRTLFPRSSSKTDLGGNGGVRRGSASKRRGLPQRKGVSFDTQVCVVCLLWC